MKRFTFVTALALLSTSAPAFAAGYGLDKPHTQASFSVTHLGLSKVHGQIPMSTGTAAIGPDGLPTAITVSFDMAGVATQNDFRDKDLREHYFEVDKYPTMTFVEKSAKGTPASFVIVGDLTLHGVTKTVTLTSHLDGQATVRGKKHYAYTGTTKVDRRDYGMTFGPLLDGALIAGNDVDITFETDATEQ